MYFFNKSLHNVGSVNRRIHDGTNAHKEVKEKEKNYK